MRRAEIVVVGAGPAGIAAAVTASAKGRQVLVLDDNPGEGGQIWRGGGGHREWLERFHRCGAEKIFNARVIAAGAADRTLVVETGGGAERLNFDKLILATGARELFLPFPGWTLPGVMGAGGLQAMVKGGLRIRAARVVVAGTGPLLLAVAAFLKEHGAQVIAIAEQAQAARIRSFAMHMVSQPGKLWQGLRLKAKLAGTPYFTDCWVEQAHGTSSLESVNLRRGGKQWAELCDYLAIGYGLWPNAELAALLGCERDGPFVKVDASQQTSVAGVYCAGEPTGIAGVDAALAEGIAAGSSAAGEAARAPHSSFAVRLARTFAIRDEVKRLAKDDTIVCRCEDVTWSELRHRQGWRAAKLQTRCGMGPCQGRICGPALETMCGWRTESLREPLFPARVESMTR